MFHSDVSFRVQQEGSPPPHSTAETCSEREVLRESWSGRKCALPDLALGDLVRSTRASCRTVSTWWAWVSQTWAWLLAFGTR